MKKIKKELLIPLIIISLSIIAMIPVTIKEINKKIKLSELRWKENLTDICIR